MSFFLLYWIIAIISGATAIGFTIAALTREKALHLKRLLLFQLSFWFTIITITLRELNQGLVVIYDDLTKIVGLLGVSLIIITLPRYINSRKPLILFEHAGKSFFIAGGLLFIHYLTSSAFYFTTKYHTEIPYFDGHRVLPVFVTFFILALAHLYTAIAFITAKEGLPAEELRILRIFSYVSFGIIPVMVITDSLRWLFPFLWNIYPVDRQFILPGFYIYLNITIILAILQENKKLLRKTMTIPVDNRWGLSAREHEVAELIINGSSYREVGEQLNISLSTVQSHIVRIYQKTGVNSKVGLIRLLF